MARDVQMVERVGSPTAAAFEAAFNAILAPLLAELIGAFEILVTDKLPSSTRLIKGMVDTDTAGATVITHPYQVKAFEAYDDVTVISDFEAFLAANPTYWVSPVLYRYSDQLGGIPNRSLMFVLYNTDATDGAANWAPGYIQGGGGGAPSGPAGGDLAGTYPNPTLADTTHGEDATTGLIVGSNAVWGDFLVDAGAGTVDLLLQKGATQYRTTVSFNQGDGVTPEWQEENIVINPANGATLDFTITMTIVGPLIQLVVTPASLGWNSRAFAQVLTPAP